MIEPQSCHYMSQNLRLHYLDWGNPDKPLLLVIHGGRDMARSWDMISLALRDDWHIVAMDLRGHGDSQWAPDGNYQIHDYLQDIATLADHLGVPCFSILAHSMGSSLATRYAAIYPERVERLVAVEGIGRTPGESREREHMPMPRLWRRWMDRQADMLMRTPGSFATPEEALARLRDKRPDLNEAIARHVTRHGIRQGEDGRYRWKHDIKATNFSPLLESEREMQEIRAAIACPVLICQGRHSFVSDPEQDGRAAQFANARMHHFEKSGHWPQYDEPEEFIRVAGGFLSDAAD